MDKKTEQRVRELAQPLWQSAAQPYNMALDFWVMAEQMVVDLAVAASRLHLDTSKHVPPFYPAWLPSTVPVERVRALAQMMWDAAGQNYKTSQECWLAAERHVHAMMRAAAAPINSPEKNHWVRDMVMMTPDAYLEQIRTAAYFLWEATGRQYGKSLEHWIEAERNILRTMTAMASRYEEGRAEGADMFSSSDSYDSSDLDRDHPSSYH